MIQNSRNLLTVSVAVCAIAAATPASAQTRSFDVPAQAATSGIPELARQADVQILASEAAVRGKAIRAVRGKMSVEEALRRALAGTGLTYSTSDGRTYILASPAAAAEPGEETVAENSEGEELLVTGTRIRGGTPASPVIVRTQDTMRNAGQTSLAEVIATIPQNFGGGTNSGVGYGVPESKGTGFGGAATINLRGLGSDATLTLLNGRRIAYAGAQQGIDVSGIPFLAIDRIEVVPDGASALYGSDAVAGVANIILKRDYEGVETMARFGASTDGGNEQQQYSAVAGTKWASGGIVASYEYGKTTPILATQRDYVANPTPYLMYTPEQDWHAAMLSAHQEIVPGLRFEVDGLYNRRRSHRYIPIVVATPYILDEVSTSESLAIASALAWQVSPKWEVSLTGTYAQNETTYGSVQTIGTVTSQASLGCYCNEAASVELAGNGTLFALPGGDVRVALGGGFRTNFGHDRRSIPQMRDIRLDRDVYYGFGEVNVPIASPAQQIPWLYSLSLSAAVRYEHYPDAYNVATPKFGLIYAPSPDLELKATWGKSFRAPTFYEQLSITQTLLYPVTQFGGTGYPAGSTALFIGGGNIDLKPEKARSWSATVALHPMAVPGLRVQIGYFNVHYRDRVVVPILFSSTALSNPIYADRVTLSPTDAQKAAAIASGTFVNVTPTPYDPSRVVAIIDNRRANAATQTAKGIDLDASYKFDIGDGGSINLSAYATYIDSNQMLTPLQPVQQLAGILFNPAHFRARAGVAWSDGGLTLSSFLNHTGKVRDTRKTVTVPVDSMTTLDLAARYRVEDGPAIFRGVDLTLSVQNLLNAKPDVIATNAIYEPPYDSTNYSAVGRFVSFAISKRW